MKTRKEVKGYKYSNGSGGKKWQRGRVVFSEGKKYTEIAEETGLSTATISRVNRSLAFGKGGYDKIFAKED